MPVGATPSPWLEPPGGLPHGANFAEVTLFCRRIGKGVYDTDVPKELFNDMMRRAARHDGYGVKHTQYKSYHTCDTVLEVGASHKDVRVVRRNLLSMHEIPGAPLIACLYDNDRHAAFSSFSCGEKLHDVRHVRRMSLRAHRRAWLVFEVHRNDVGKVVRRVLVEIMLDDRGQGPSLASEMPEVRRTVENTVHLAILASMSPTMTKKLLV
jgi:hypothetical protein